MNYLKFEIFANCIINDDTNLINMKNILLICLYFYQSAQSGALETKLDILGMITEAGLADQSGKIDKELERLISIHNIWKVYNSAKKYHLSSLAKACHDFIDSNALQMMKLPSTLRLSAEDVKNIISRDSFTAPEMDIFKFVKAWIEANPGANFKPVIDSLRLDLFSQDELLGVVAESNLVSDR